ncbi:NUDIX hydrolase [Rhodoferax koreense]|uniref:NUDIX hydrolase n=1 Tax=Rhodoferax koreensis TaxID=1842727 RepID=A0A1P8JSQ3_9BURK|nr:NUDIX hydrolase [Rhodoferax koreense]APW36755.1 NUDIX hydrolase [Rhodoferax koreense]
MELNYSVVHTPPRAAASVVLLRDGPLGLEVFLVQRHGASEVLGGAYVFPGGKLDAEDAEPELLAALDRPLDRLHAAMGEPDIDAATAAALHVAALREVFEESGVLFARPGTLAEVGNAAALLREGTPFNAALVQLGLRLQTAAVLPWSRWVTPTSPSVMNKRFDTRFFVAAVPEGQAAVHDNHEAVHSLWLPPRVALEQYWDGAIDLAPPQIMSLAHLARHATLETVFAEARARRPPVIQPEPFDDEGVRTICYPGDPRHSIAARALPGPTRLRYRNKRFEPVEGFEALFN